MLFYAYLICKVEFYKKSKSACIPRYKVNLSFENSGFINKERDFMGIFTGLFKSRDKPQNSYDSPSYTYFFGRANSGKRVTDRTALQHIAVYACVRVLSEAIAQLPLHVYKYNDKGKERVPQHPLYFLLHDHIFYSVHLL